MDFAPVLQKFSALFQTSKVLKKKSLPFTVMILSPHPDDECIVGSLPLRLLHENNAHVVNIAVTLGSNKDRQKARREELTKACDFLEIENIFLAEEWKTKEKELKSLIQKYQPQLIIAPHTKDHHPTHVRTGELLKKVLPKLPKLHLLVAWSEFWAPMAKPNLLLEVPVEILELQMRALEFHVGEVSRNPYHLRLPAWMMDNVRRGSEIIGGKGTSASDMAFGVIYKLQLLKAGRLSTPKFSEPTISSTTDIGQMFKLILDAASGSKTRVK